MTDNADHSTADASIADDDAVLTLHAVRVLGGPTSAAAARLYGLDPARVEQQLLDWEALGWVRRSRTTGNAWYLTEIGRAAGERQVAQQVGALGVRASVASVHDRFLPLNERLTAACTRWQLRPSGGDPMAANDHTDWKWDEQVIKELGSVGRRMTVLLDELTPALPRFAVHPRRYASALDRVDHGDRSWVDAPDRPSCHIVWIQLHEDLIATLGIRR